MITLERLKAGQLATMGNQGARAFALAVFIELHGPELSLRAAADSLGLSKDGVRRTLALLVEHGWCRTGATALGTNVTMVPFEVSHGRDREAPGCRTGATAPVSSTDPVGALSSPPVSHGRDTSRPVRQVKRDGTGAVTRARAAQLLALDPVDPGSTVDPDQEIRRGHGGGYATPGGASAPRGSVELKTRDPHVNRLTGEDPALAGRMVPADELKILRTAREKRDAQQSSFTAVEAVVLFRANFWRTFAHEDPETSGPKARERAAARVRELVVGPFDGDFAQAVDYLRWIILRWKRSQDPDTPVKERPFVSGATPSIATITKPGSYFVREYLADRNRGDSDQ